MTMLEEAIRRFCQLSPEQQVAILDTVRSLEKEPRMEKVGK